MEEIILEERNDMRGNYLVAAGVAGGSYKEEMLKNGKIEGLLAVTGQDFNGRHELWYETTAKQVLKMKFAQRAPGVGEITELMRQIGQMAQRLAGYLLEEEELVLELAHIFEGERGEYLFLYLPGYQKKRPGGICGLMEELMEYVDYEDHRAVSFVYLLHARSRQQTCGIFSLQRLCEEISEAARQEEESRRKDDFLEEFETPEKTLPQGKRPLPQGKRPWKERAENFLGTGMREVEREGARGELSGGQGKESRPAPDTGMMPAGFGRLLQKLKNCIKPGREENNGFHAARAEDEMPGEGCMDTVLLGQETCSDTVLLTGGSDTVLLQQERYILRSLDQRHEDIVIDCYPFCIGKEGAGGGYALKEPVVSRRHARVLKEGGRCFLEDLRSLNGTYVNGKRLLPDEKKELKEGDQVGFADICFIFACCKAPDGI